MQSKKTKALVILVVCAGIAGEMSWAANAEAAKGKGDGIFSRKSIVEQWLSLYARVDAGKAFWRKGSSITKRPKATNVFGAGIGYRFSDYPLRLEFSFYKNNFRVSGASNAWTSAHTVSYVVNAYRDIVLDNDVHDSAPLRGVVPYLTAGIGSVHHSSIKGDGGYSHGRKKCSAWNAGIGAKYYLDKIWAIDLAGKYVDLGSFPTRNGSVSMRGCQVIASAVMHFW